MHQSVTDLGSAHDEGSVKRTLRPRPYLLACWVQEKMVSLLIRLFGTQ